MKRLNLINDVSSHSSVPICVTLEKSKIGPVKSSLEYTENSFRPLSLFSSVGRVPVV